MEYLKISLDLIWLVCLFGIIRLLLFKINFQSSIIKNQEKYNNFFDVSKLQEYVELCNVEKDKLLNLERQSLQQEFKLQKINFLLKQSKNNNSNQIIEIE